MAEEAFTLWELGSGLPLDGTEATVTAASFGYNNEYAAGACVLELTFTDDESNEATQLYSVGKGWEPQDGGALVGHESGRNMRINNRSIYGMWIAAFMQCPGAMEYAHAVGKEPNDASLWLGCRFLLKAHTYEKQDKKEGTTIVPAQFLGNAETGTAAATTAAKPATATKTLAPRPGAASAPASAPAAAAGDDDMDPAVRKALMKIAGSVESFDQWLDLALEVEGVAGNKPLERQVMSKKPDGLYAQFTA